MKLIYVCSPFRGERDKNMEKAKEYAQWVYKLGALPLAVHLFLENCTGRDERNGDRKELLRLGRQYVLKCDEVWVFGDTISEGMKKEIKTAENNKIPIRFFNNETEENKKEEMS